MTYLTMLVVLVVLVVGTWGGYMDANDGLYGILSG